MLVKIESRRRGRQRMRWLDGITDSMGRFGWSPGVGDGQGSLACCGSWGHKELDMTEWLNWTEYTLYNCKVKVNVTQSYPTLCDPMNHRMPGLPVHHQLLSIQTHVHWVDDAIQPSHPLSSPSPPALNLSQHQGLFQWVSSSYQVAKVLELQLYHQSFR